MKRRISQGQAMRSVFGRSRVTHFIAPSWSGHVGLTLSADPPPELRAPLERIQNELFDLGADLCVPYAPGDGRLRVEQKQIDGLERLCDDWNARLEPLTSFVLPGGSELAARLHVARTVCRRAEVAALQARPLGV